MVTLLRYLSLVVVLIGTQITPAAAQEKAFPQSIWAQWNMSFSPQFPGQSWRRFATPEDAGWSSEKLEETRALSKEFESAAVMLVYDGVVLAEWGQVERRFKGHSIRKSLLSALYGIAVDRGQINLKESLSALKIDDDTPLTAQEKTATVADLLKARSGVYLPAAYESKGMKERRPGRGSRAPGSSWHYNNWDFNALATIYNRKTNGDLFRAFKDQIADPLQMQDFDLRHTYYHLEAHNSRHPAYPFRMSARDLARFGLLFLNQGAWNDQQLISETWVRESTRSYSSSEESWRGYGYMWWRYMGRLTGLEAYEAAGSGGHRIIVVPGARLVMIHRTDTYAGKGISGRKVRMLLLSALRARIGPARAKPNIVDRKPQGETEEGTPPPSAEIDAVLGTYRNQRFQLRVERRAGGLEIYEPTFGRFHLLRAGRNEYVIEDALYPVQFEREDEALASGLTITLPHSKPVQLKRKP